MSGLSALGFADSREAMESNRECTICQDPLDLRDSGVVWLGCCHAFHGDCMRTYMQVKGWSDESLIKCPNCRLGGQARDFQDINMYIGMYQALSAYICIDRYICVYIYIYQALSA